MNINGSTSRKRKRSISPSMHDLNDPKIWSLKDVYNHNEYQKMHGSKSKFIIKCILDHQCKRNKPILVLKNYKRHYQFCCGYDKPSNDQYPLFSIHKQDKVDGYEWLQSTEIIKDRETKEQKTKRRETLRNQQNFMANFLNKNNVCSECKDSYYSLKNCVKYDYDR